MASRWFTILLYCVIPLLAFSQNERIDSLKSALSDEILDTFQVKYRIDLAGELRYVNAQEAITVCKEGLEIAHKIGYERGEMVLNYMAGVSYYVSGDSKASIPWVESSLKIAEKRDDKNAISFCYNLLGASYEQAGEIENALEYLFKSLNLAEELNDTFAMINAYANVGVQFFHKGDKINAGKYYTQALELGIQKKDTINFPALYMNMAQVEDDLDAKLSYQNKALHFAETTGNLNATIYANNDIGSSHILREEYEESIPYLREAIRQAKKMGDDFSLSIAYLRIGEAFSGIGQLDSASFYIPMGIQIGEKLETLREVQEGYKDLALVFEKKGNYRRALSNLKTATVLGDSLYNQSISEKLAEADARYENQKKEAEIARQKLEIARQEILRNRIIIGSVLFLLVGSGIFQWYYNRQRRKKKEAENALELQQAEAEKLRELDQLKSRFFANISHELRTPLTLISAPLENALHGKMNPEIEKDISLAHSSSKKLLTMINEILDLSKLESGQLSLNESTANLQNLLRRIFYSFESFATLHDVELKFEYDLPESINISVDKAKFEDILNNLISNAIKFSDTGGQVTLMVKGSGEDALISVIDNGKGIPKEELSKIFGRFYQASHEGTPLSGGTGIGLALAKELAQLFGGDIQVESEIGKGSIFTFRMPLKKVDEAVIDSEIEVKEDVMAKGEMTSYEPILIQGERARILIVEDNRDMSEFLKRILSPYYHCTTAMNGVEGMKKIQTESFDLITSDVMMPGMDGFDFKEKVNSLPKLRHLPFIMLTARSRDVDKLIGLQLGVDDYITKPFNAKELLARIQNTLQNKVERDNWIRENEEIKETKNTEESAESQILKEAERLVLSNLSDPQFNVSSLAKNIGYGERQLRRVIKKMTGFSPVRFILEIRLLKAYQFLVQRKFLSVSEVRNEVGIESSSYFSSKFTERFGKNPKEMLEE